MNDSEIVELVKKMNISGIQISAIYEPIGCTFCLKPADVPRFLADKDSFFANECALSKNEYLEWKKYVKDGCRCTGNVRGKPCGKPISGSKDLSPQEYARRKSGGTLLCSYHQKKKKTD